jgi:hypothetical protein
VMLNFALSRSWITSYRYRYGQGSKVEILLYQRYEDSTQTWLETMVHLINNQSVAPDGPSMGGGARLLSNLRLVLVFRYVGQFFFFIFPNYQS